MHDDTQNVRANLAAACEDSAEWRRLKAAQYPDDDRNVLSAIALEVAAREIRDLPDDDPRLVYLAKFWEDVRDRDAVLDRVIGRHGFGREAAQGTAALLAAVVAEALSQRRGKVAV